MAPGSACDPLRLTRTSGSRAARCRSGDESLPASTDRGARAWRAPEPLRAAPADQARPGRGPGDGTVLSAPTSPIRWIATPSSSRPAAPPAHPLRVLETAEDWNWWRCALRLHDGCAGAGQLGDRVALAFSFGPHVQFWAAKEGLQEIGAMGVSLGGMGSVQRLQTIARGRGDSPLVYPDLRPAPTRGGCRAAARVGPRIGRAGALHRRARRLAARPCAPGSRRASGARLHRSRRADGGRPVRRPVPRGHGLHIDENEFICEILDDGPEPDAAGRARRAGDHPAPPAPASPHCATGPATR